MSDIYVSYASYDFPPFSHLETSKGGLMMPKGKAREFNLGLVDFGALVCVAKNTKCDICLMADFCLYFKEVVREQ